MSEEITLKMRCSACKNIVPYAVTKTHESYNVIKKAVEKQHGFVFNDFCGFCDKPARFSVVYFDGAGQEVKKQFFSKK